MNELSGSELKETYIAEELASLLDIYPPCLMVEQVEIRRDPTGEYFAQGVMTVTEEYTAGHFPGYPMMRLSDLGIVMSTVGHTLLQYDLGSSELFVVAGEGLRTLSNTPLRLGDEIVIIARIAKPRIGQYAISAQVLLEAQPICSYDRIEFIGSDGLNRDLPSAGVCQGKPELDLLLSQIKFELPLEHYGDAPPTLAIDIVGFYHNPLRVITLTVVSDQLCAGYHLNGYERVHLGHLGRICSQICQPAIKQANPRLQGRILLATEGGLLRRHSLVPIRPGDLLMGVGKVNSNQSDGFSAQAEVYCRNRLVASFDNLRYTATSIKVLSRIRP